MSEEGERIPVEHQSNAGKWILILLAAVFVAASVYAHVTMHSWIESLRKDLNSSQAQVAELNGLTLRKLRGSGKRQCLVKVGVRFRIPPAPQLQDPENRQAAESHPAVAVLACNW